MFIFNLSYRKDLSEVEQYLPEHRQYLDRYYAAGKFICSGRKNPRVGGIILCNCANAGEAQDILRQDPFYRNGVADYDVVEFIPSKFSADFPACLRKG